jgi:hypothetical protein
VAIRRLLEPFLTVFISFGALTVTPHVFGCHVRYWKARFVGRRDFLCC